MSRVRALRLPWLEVSGVHTHTGPTLLTGACALDMTLLRRDRRLNFGQDLSPHPPPSETVLLQIIHSGGWLNKSLFSCPGSTMNNLVTLGEDQLLISDMGIGRDAFVGQFIRDLNHQTQKSSLLLPHVLKREHLVPILSKITPHCAPLSIQ